MSPEQRHKEMLKSAKWAFFSGYICTANEDGSIPLNSVVVLDARFIHERDVETVVAIHNELRGAK